MQITTIGLDLAKGVFHVVGLDEHIQFYARELEAVVGQDEDRQGLQTIPGVGPIVAGAFITMVGDAGAFRRGRDVSALLGLVPAQHGSGGRDRLLGISRRGDRHVRALLVQGAQSVVFRAPGKEDRLSRWINRLRQERGTHKRWWPWPRRWPVSAGQHCATAPSISRPTGRRHV